MHRELIDGENIFVIHDFLSPEECAQQIERSEALGYEAFTIDGEVIAGYRNNARLIHDDQALANDLWAKAAAFIPPLMEEEPASGLNPHFRYYRYTGSEAFAPHFDGCVRVGNCVSKLTFLVYLSDVPQGGETRFYGNDAKVRFAIPPVRGKALIFNHLILHEGVAVEAGAKYVLRSDVMYGRLG